MKAEDTVIKNFSPYWVTAEIHDVDGEVVCDEKYDMGKLLKSQAEISFKAGMEYGNKEAYESGVYNGYAEGLADGIKEVVNWINSTHLKKTVNYNEPNLIIPLRYWNSKLKEWRI